MALDYPRIAQEFIRALRGHRSQTAFSRRLGYRTNVVYTWESGRNWPTAAHALHAASRAGIDVRAALGRFYRAPPAWLSTTDPTSPAGVAHLLDDLRGRTSIVDLARASRRSRFRVARFLKGDSEPRLPDFFLLIEKSSLRLFDFIACFVDPSTLPSIASAWRELEEARRAAYDVPWTQAILRALELSDYRGLPHHQPGWLAHRIGISRREEVRCLRLLARTGQIRLRRRRWEPREVRALDTRRDQKAETLVKAFWTEVALGRLRAGRDGLFSYNLFAVSEADLGRLQDLYLAYFRQTRGIIRDSEPSERVALVSLLFVPLDEPPSQAPDSPG